MRNLQGLRTKLAGIVLGSLICLGGCGQATGGGGDISPRLESTGILYIDAMKVEGSECVLRRFVIDGGTYGVRRKLDVRQEGEFGPTSLVPMAKREAIWAVADELSRMSPRLKDVLVEGQPKPGNYLIVCVEARQPSGEYVVFWPLGQAPSAPKARRLLALLREAAASDWRTRFSPS